MCARVSAATTRVTRRFRGHLDVPIDHPGADRHSANLGETGRVPQQVDQDLPNADPIHVDRGQVVSHRDDQAQALTPEHRLDSADGLVDERPQCGLRPDERQAMRAASICARSRMSSMSDDRCLAFR